MLTLKFACDSKHKLTVSSAALYIVTVDRGRIEEHVGR